MVRRWIIVALVALIASANADECLTEDYAMAHCAPLESSARDSPAASYCRGHCCADGECCAQGNYKKDGHGCARLFSSPVPARFHHVQSLRALRLDRDICKVVGPKVKARKEL